MRSEWIWKILFSIVATAAIWHFAEAARALHTYYLLDSPAVARGEWKIKEVTTDHFTPFAKYTYTVKGESYQGESELPQDVYRNRKVLEEKLPKYNEKEWVAWYNSQNPKISSLHNKFPFKECLYAATLIGILLYFIGVKRHINRAHSSWK